jgi:hypothetical protein
VDQPGAQPAPPQAVTAKPRVDACSLLTSNEIEGVQGEAVKETKLTGQDTGGVSVSQCFFTLPTFTNSVILMVSQEEPGAGATDPKDFWRETFHKEKSEKHDRDRRQGEAEEITPPRKNPGVGDEAYWTGNRVGGVLYALKGDMFLRLSTGGPANQAKQNREVEDPDPEGAGAIVVNCAATGLSGNGRPNISVAQHANLLSYARR